MVWTRPGPFSARCTAVPRRTEVAVSHALYGHVACSDVIARAWDDVRDNRGAPGVDGVSIEDIERSGTLATALRERTYRPAPLRRVYISKAGESAQNASRPLSIPTVCDRVAMAAAIASHMACRRTDLRTEGEDHPAVSRPTHFEAAWHALNTLDTVRNRPILISSMKCFNALRNASCCSTECDPEVAQETLGRRVRRHCVEAKQTTALPGALRQSETSARDRRRCLQRRSQLLPPLFGPTPNQSRIDLPTRELFHGEAERFGTADHGTARRSH
jgi:hypothetical protein